MVNENSLPYIKRGTGSYVQNRMSKNQYLSGVESAWAGSTPSTLMAVRQSRLTVFVGQNPAFGGLLAFSGSANPSGAQST